jgi:hypothetical protein
LFEGTYYLWAGVDWYAAEKNISAV